MNRTALAPSVILTIITGRLWCPIGDLHKGIDALCGRRTLNVAVPGECAKYGPVLAAMLPCLSAEPLPDMSGLSRAESKARCAVFAAELEAKYGRSIFVSVEKGGAS